LRGLRKYARTRTLWYTFQLRLRMQDVLC